MTGTDTGVGKTVVAIALLEAVVATGRRAVGMKPISAGVGPGSACNADVDALACAGNVDASQSDRNPFAFAPAIAPHLAANDVGVRIDLAQIAAAYARLAASADVVVVEGAGGVRVPIDARHDMLDIAVALGLPVLLVVGMRLGCINHALLSAAAIEARGLRMAGWVANCIDPRMPALCANITDLSVRLKAPLAANVQWRQPPRFPATIMERLQL
ncbi:MAG: dethiobiotin synthase [Betaproteobacteria bacterium]